MASTDTMASVDTLGQGSIEDARVRIETLEHLVAQLQQALDSRVLIEQAKGVLSERHRLPPQEAFELLRRSARNKQRNIHQLAAEIIASACPNGSVVG